MRIRVAGLRENFEHFVQKLGGFLTRSTDQIFEFRGGKGYVQGAFSRC